MFPYLCLLATHHHIAASESRAEFWRAISAVQRGWTQYQVRQVLGNPDDIVKNSVPSYFGQGLYQEGYDQWRYGSNGHNSVGTLGTVVFRDGLVDHEVGGSGKPPSAQLVGEVELEKAIRIIATDVQGWSRYVNPGKVLRVDNFLMSKGQTKALAILREYERVSPGSNLAHSVAITFTSPMDRPVPQDEPEAPYDFSGSELADSELRYKEFMVDDVPIDL